MFLQLHHNHFELDQGAASTCLIIPLHFIIRWDTVVNAATLVRATLCLFMCSPTSITPETIKTLLINQLHEQECPLNKRSKAIINKLINFCN